MAISPEPFDWSARNLAWWRTTFLTVPAVKILNFVNQDGGRPRPPFWQIENQSYLGNGYTDWHKIWHGDTYCPSEPDWSLKFRTFINPRWRTADILKNWKMAISPEQFDQSAQKVARWCILALWTGLAIKLFTIWKSNMVDGCHLEKSKNRHISTTVWSIVRSLLCHHINYVYYFT